MFNLYAFLELWLLAMSVASRSTEKITEELLEDIFKNFQQQSKTREKNRKYKLLTTHSADLSLLRNKDSDPQIHIMENAQLAFEHASEELYNRFKLSRDVINNYLPRLKLSGEIASQLKQNCSDTMRISRCDSRSKYRRIDGQCNNLRHPRWGSANTCQPRLLPANYVGISQFRVSLNGQPLPRPRQLSLNVHYDVNRPTNYVNHMYMFFGQLLDHDITQTPQSTAMGKQSINCCPPDENNPPQCAPILLSADDPFYSQFNISCMNFVRSVPCSTCTLGPRQLMNEVTSTIDASFVYGNSPAEISRLRSNNTGQLRTQNSDVGELLPPSPNPQNDQCSFPQTNDICFEAGDSRVNQHTVLTSLQTIFLREHNRIATRLSQINPQWDDERLFQEARRILGAEMQAITYKEYLPITLGNDRMNFFGLWTGRWTQYNPNVDPTTLIEFTTAAFRFGHTMVNSIVANRPVNATNQLLLLRNDFFQPFSLYTEYIGPLVAGASRSPAQFFDRHLVPDVTDYLYRVRGSQTGLDLASINIQRGRDHGIPTYVETVRYCSNGSINIRNFNDLIRYSLMRPEQADVLERNYRFVQDIDLWPGILSEIYLPEAVVGPTAACIIGLQYHKMKYGDRFYFEHTCKLSFPLGTGRKDIFKFLLYEGQLEQLRRTTLSQIICLNTVATQMPSNAMLFTSRNNPSIQCRNVRGIDLSYWRE